MNTGIALFVYNRPEHTLEVLKGLRENNISKLYIFSDGNKNGKDKKPVEDVRNLIDSIDWCDTEVIKHDENKGLADSIADGVNHVFKKNKRVIVLEDDCVPGEDYIAFMEKCLDKYENNERVMNVTGYSLPIAIPEDYEYDIYFSYRSSSWGWGTWKRAWKYFDRDESILKEIKKSAELRKKINRAGEDLIPMLKDQVDDILDSWAVYWSINIIKNKGVCVNPVKSKIKNIGHDGTGTHCLEDNRYQVKLVKEDVRSMFLPNHIFIDEKIMERYRKYYSPGIKKKARRGLAQILKWLGLYDAIKRLKN